MWSLIAGWGLIVIGFTVIAYMLDRKRIERRS